MKNIPNKIYLQADPENEKPEFFSEGGTTWCSDRIYDNDIPYYRKQVKVEPEVSLPTWVNVGEIILMWDEEDECFYKSRITEIDKANKAVMYIDVDERSRWNGHQFETSYEELNDLKLAKKAS